LRLVETAQYDVPTKAVADTTVTTFKPLRHKSSTKATLLAAAAGLLRASDCSWGATNSVLWPKLRLACALEGTAKKKEAIRAACTIKAQTSDAILVQDAMANGLEIADTAVCNDQSR